MNRTARPGFTLIELLVVVSIIALLMSILLPSLGKAKELANRVHCTANLRGICQSMAIYGQENNDLYPSVMGLPNGSYGVNLAGTVGSTTTTDQVVSSYYTSAKARAGSPPACLWLMVLRNYTGNPKIYLCKSDPAIAGPAATVDNAGRFFDNFQTPNQVSYSIAYPWDGAGNTAIWWRSNYASDLPLMSDMAPAANDGGKNPAAPKGSLSLYNSGNHGGAGQNVAYGDSHAEWQTSPYVGEQGDNIFTRGGPQGTGSVITSNSLGGAILTGAIPYDTVMVPARRVSDGGF